MVSSIQKIVSSELSKGMQIVFALQLNIPLLIKTCVLIIQPNLIEVIIFSLLFHSINIVDDAFIVMLSNNGNTHSPFTVIKQLTCGGVTWPICGFLKTIKIQMNLVLQ